MSNNAKIVGDYYKKNLTLFTDLIFREVATNKNFVTELLRVFLNDEKLEIIELTPQRDISIFNQRRVTLDVYCKLSSGKVVNVEVENDTYGERHDHQRRVRYYGSMIDVKNLSPSQDFSELPDLYMIYLTLRDFIGLGRTVYHVERQIAETQSYLNNGYHEIYINAEVDDKSSIAEVMKVLSTTDYVNNNFKTITRMKEEKIMPVEVERALEGLKEECRIEGRQEGSLRTYISLLQEGLISEEVVLNKLNISKEELNKKIKELGI